MGRQIKRVRAPPDINTVFRVTNFGQCVLEGGREGGREGGVGRVSKTLSIFPLANRFALSFYIPLPFSFPRFLTCIILIAVVAAKTALASFMVGKKS